MNYFCFGLFISMSATLISCSGNGYDKVLKNSNMENADKVVKTDQEWKQILSPHQFEVLRNKGTERSFSGEYYLHKEKGVYACSACGQELFLSEAKFDSGCGWPSFYDVLNVSNVVYVEDTSHGMIRTEITCAKCGGHLGHVFDDGPLPTGLRYCINSVSMEFKK